MKIVNTDTDNKPSTTINEEHKAIIDAWFNNGFNGAKAVQEHRPDITYNTARVTFNAIKKGQSEYIQAKQQQLRATASLEPEQITKELINWIYSDATDYIGLSVDDLKALPNELKRCIQSVKHRVKEYSSPKGDPIREEVLEVRIIDKSKAVEILNKMLGHYALDNKQKGNSINVANLNINELKFMANIMLKSSNNNS